MSAPAPSSPPTARVGWWTESIADGGSHFGHLDDGRVAADCDGHEFLPLPHPQDPTLIEPMRVPADEEHACPRCRELHPRT